MLFAPTIAVWLLSLAAINSYNIAINGADVFQGRWAALGPARGSVHVDQGCREAGLLAPWHGTQLANLTHPSPYARTGGRTDTAHALSVLIFALPVAPLQP